MTPIDRLHQHETLGLPLTLTVPEVRALAGMLAMTDDAMLLLVNARSIVDTATPPMTGCPEVDLVFVPDQRAWWRNKVQEWLHRWAHRE